MARPDDRFIVVPMPRLPAEVSGEDIEKQLQVIRDRNNGKSSAEIIADRKRWHCWQSWGLMKTF